MKTATKNISEAEQIARLNRHADTLMKEIALRLADERAMEVNRLRQIAAAMGWKT
jgi:hypothetical protein